MHIDDDDITSRPVQQRSTGVMFERPTLFDMTVEQNIEFALDDARQSEKQRHDLVSIVMSSLIFLDWRSGIPPRYLVGKLSG